MPFREVKRPSGFIRIKTCGKVTISSSLISKFFGDKTHVKIFHDDEKKLIGFQPSDSGYKVMNAFQVFRIKCSFLPRITQGEFYPIWSKKHKMLVLSYGKRKMEN